MDERAHRSLERRLRVSELRRFKPIADFDWTWPTKIERDVIERALTLDFLAEARNLVLVGANAGVPGKRSLLAGVERPGQNHDRAKHLSRRGVGRSLRALPHRIVTVGRVASTDT